MPGAKKTALLLGAAMGVIGVAVAACSSSGSGGGNPGGNGPFAVTLNGNGFGGDAGKFALFRVIGGGATAFCTSASVGGGSPSFSFTTPAVLTTGVNWTGEVYIATNTNSGASGIGYARGGNPATRDPGATIAIGMVTSSQTLILSSSGTATNNLSWTPGLDCPG